MVWHARGWAKHRALPGDLGQRVYRVDLRQPDAPRLVYEAPVGSTLTRVAVTAEGGVLAAPMEWNGQLWALDAPKGQPF